MNKILYNYYWIAATLTPKLLYGVLPLILVLLNFEDAIKSYDISFGDIFIYYIIFLVAVGWSAILIVIFFKCSACNKRALVHSGEVPKKVSLNRTFIKRWLVPDELFSQYFYCCKCGEKIKAK
jgi:hypothetical protein